MNLARQLGLLAIASLTAIASGSAAPARTGARSDVMTVTGNVVDAACFMIHPAAANTPTHQECGTACMKHGVPLAIAGDDGSLYFPADGNKRLAGFHGQHVKAVGAVTEKKEPMELKMAVSEKNTMTVKVEGGYKVIDLQSIATAPK